MLGNIIGGFIVILVNLCPIMTVMSFGDNPNIGQYPSLFTYKDKTEASMFLNARTTDKGFLKRNEIQSGLMIYKKHKLTQTRNSTFTNCCTTGGNCTSWRKRYRSCWHISRINYFVLCSCCCNFRNWNCCPRAS